MKVSYISLDAASMQDKVKVSEEDISAYYDQHKSSYGQPGVKLQRDPAENRGGSQRRAGRAEEGRRFCHPGEEKSTDIISRRTGGELGWLEPETTADELKQANLTEKGQLSGVVKSSVGFLIVRLNDIEPEK